MEPGCGKQLNCPGAAPRGVALAPTPLVLLLFDAHFQRNDMYMQKWDPSRHAQARVYLLRVPRGSASEHGLRLSTVWVTSAEFIVADMTRSSPLI